MLTSGINITQSSPVINTTTTISPVTTLSKEPDKPNLTEISRILKNKYIFKSEIGSKMYRYYDGYFKPDAEDFIRSVLSDTLTKFQKNEIIAKIRDTTHIEREDWNKYPQLINMNNGVLDIENKHLIPHDPKFHFTYKFNIKYDPDAQCPLWFNVINNSLKPEDVLILQAWFKYHFTLRNPYKKFVMILGKKNTGKSTILGILSEFIGINNVSAIPMEYFSNNSHRACASLYLKKANICADMGEQVINDVNALKGITGNDMVNAAFMGQLPFQYVPDAKITFGINRMPQLSLRIQEDEAFWDRVIIFQTICEPIKEPDKTLLEKLIKELPGIFNWALNGDFKYLDNPTLNAMDIWQESVNGANPLKAFIDEYYDKDIDGYTQVKFIKHLWDLYRHEHKIIDISDIKFNIYMERLGFIQDRIGEDRLRVWYGLKYKETC